MNGIETVLQSLNRPVTTGAIVKGPQVWRVQLHPERRELASGRLGQMTQIRHLRSLQDDIALALNVPSVAIVKDGGLWLEIPRKRETIYAPSLRCKSGMKFPIGFGLSAANKTLSIDLADPKTPHVLIGGTTGSGKSVCLRAIVYSLVRHCTPGLLQFVVIDTKHELEGLQKLPHILGNVVTDPYTAYRTLKAVLQLARNRYEAEEDMTLPRVVVVIDELGDLIQSNPDIEHVLVSIAQLGRAAGVHLVVATQRPSRDVVTGLIHDNLPVKIAFAVPSKWASRTIIGCDGAENLLGNGDGLLLLSGTVTRFQGAYVEDGEILTLVGSTYTIVTPRKGEKTQPMTKPKDGFMARLRKAVAVL